MSNRKGFRAAAWGLALGLAAVMGTAGAVRADGDGNEPGKQVIKKKIVVVDQDGKQKVWEGNGPLVRRGYLGIGLTELTPELRTHFGVPEEAGVMVSKVEPGSPAEKAGIKVGDILTRVDGNAIKSSWDITARIRKLDDGQQVPLEVWRNGKAQNVSAAIVERERPELDMGPLLFKEGDGQNLVLKMNPGDWKGFEELKSPEGMKNFQIRRLTSPREAEMEKQIKELEKRIAELEKQIKKP
jgi:hypothetical protein